MARKTTAARGAKKRADDLFSKIVRSRGRCEDCGSERFLQTAHIVSRRFANTRCDEDNALCLCARCHHHYTDHPVDFGQFVIRKMGEEPYLRLQHRAHATNRVVWNDVVQRLKIRAQELEVV